MTDYITYDNRSDAYIYECTSCELATEQFSREVFFSDIKNGYKLVQCAKCKKITGCLGSDTPYVPDEWDEYDDLDDVPVDEIRKILKEEAEWLLNNN